MSTGRSEIFLISVVAERVGVHVRTLRVYEEEGLVRPVRRNSYRLYSAADIARLTIITYLTQRLGINIAGVRLLLSLYDQGRIGAGDLIPGAAPTPSSITSSPEGHPKTSEQNGHHD